MKKNESILLIMGLGILSILGALWYDSYQEEQKRKERRERLRKRLSGSLEQDRENLNHDWENIINDCQEAFKKVTKDGITGNQSTH